MGTSLKTAVIIVLGFKVENLNLETQNCSLSAKIDSSVTPD